MIKKKILLKTSKQIRYEITSEWNVFSSNSRSLTKHFEKNTNPFFVVDYNVDRLYGENLKKYFSDKGLLSSENQWVTFGTSENLEKEKTMRNCLDLVKKFNAHGVARKDLVVLIGGGVVLDLGGLASQLFRRGLTYLKIPTTLIGMIDAGIGVKVGVNFDNGKNKVGSFYNSVACINDLSFLKTLPSKEIRQGMAEIIKMGLIYDKRIIKIIEKSGKEIVSSKFQKDINTKKLINLAITAMLDNLKVNLFEKKLARLVDFGHTFSPWIEMASKNDITHGEAVSIDMALTIQIAYILKKCTRKTLQSSLKLLQEYNLPIFDPIFLDYNNKLSLVKSIRDIIKHRGNKLNLPYPKKIGKGGFLQVSEFPNNNLEKVMLKAIDSLQKVHQDCNIEHI